jgi:hypothetical protein
MLSMYHAPRQRSSYTHQHRWVVNCSLIRHCVKVRSYAFAPDLRNFKKSKYQTSTQLDRQYMVASPAGPHLPLFTALH